MGKYNFRNRDSYEGDWIDDVMHGFGIFKWMTGNRVGDCYIGDWVQGKRDGKGEYTYASGDKYEGMFKNNEPHGKGKFVQFRQINVDPREGKVDLDATTSSDLSATTRPKCNDFYTDTT